MPAYRRPDWPYGVFRDGAGAVINYGSRWRGDGPPSDTYSVVTHPERFAPLHLVADALIEHLVETYDVQISWDASCSQDFLRPAEFERLARLTPNDSAAAPLTFGFTTYPGLILHAGLLHDLVYPICGCDACDETAIGQAELLEGHVSAVVAGHYREAYIPNAQLPIEFAMGSDQMGGQGGSSTTEGYPADLLATAGAKLRELPDHWLAAKTLIVIELPIGSGFSALNVPSVHSARRDFPAQSLESLASSSAHVKDD